MRTTGRPPRRVPDGAPIHYERQRRSNYTVPPDAATSGQLFAPTEASTGAIRDKFDTFFKCGI